MLGRRHFLAISAASIFAPRLVHAAQADAWPDRPVHMVVPIAAGGPTDTNARILAEQLSKIWGQQVVIDNKGGAGTNIGNAFVAHSDPDGYTLLCGTSSLASNGALYRSLDYKLQPACRRFLGRHSQSRRQPEHRRDVAIHPG